MFKFDNLEDKYTAIGRKVKVVIAGITIAASAIVSDAKSPEYNFQNISEVINIIPIKNNFVNNLLADNQMPKINPNDSSALEWLEELGNCRQNDWDGEGAKFVSETTIRNCREIISKSAEYQRYLTDIYATELGTVCIQWHNFKSDNLVNVEVSPQKMAFYFDSPSDGLFESLPKEFDERAVEQLIEKLNLV